MGVPREVAATLRGAAVWLRWACSEHRAGIAHTPARHELGWGSHSTDEPVSMLCGRLPTKGGVRILVNQLKGGVIVVLLVTTAVSG